MSVSGLSSPQVCPESNQEFTESDLLQVFPYGIATNTIAVDIKTKTMSKSALNDHINQLKAAGYIPETQINPRTGLVDMDKKTASDTKFHNDVQSEYCYYESRYLYAMKKFLEYATSLNKDDVKKAKRMLAVSQDLNLKVNSILEITNILGNNRTESCNILKNKITGTNDAITTTSRQVKNHYSLLSRDNAVVETQKQMIIYTKEKNDAIMNQISLFTILNAFAIGAIFAIVR
jgi:hypothetical protein